MCIELKLRRLDRGKVTGFATATAKSLQSCPTLQPHPWDSPGGGKGSEDG